MSVEPHIRFARKEDIPQVVALGKMLAAHEGLDYSENGQLQSLIRELFVQPAKLYCLVVEHEEDIVGYATYMKQYATLDGEDYIYIDCLYLKKNARGLGLGKKLIHQIQQKSTKLNCTLLQWQTPTNNTDAIHFYKKIGATAKSKQRFFLST